MSGKYTDDSMVHDRDSALQAASAAMECLQDLKRMMLEGEAPNCRSAFLVADAIVSLSTAMAWLEGGCSADSLPSEPAAKDEEATRNASESQCGNQPSPQPESAVMPICSDDASARVASSVFGSRVI